MTKKTSVFAVAGLVGAATLLTANSALAGGFALREQSTYYQGSSFAGAAAGGSLSSMFWNPAALGTVGPGLTNEVIVNFVLPNSDVTVTDTGTLGTVYPALTGGDTFDTGNRGDIGLDAFVPASYGAYRINDRIAVGFSLNAPFGLATKYDDLNDPIRNVAGTSEVFSLNAAPTVAFRVTDTFTVAVGAQTQYMDVRYTSNAAALEGDDVGFGFTAGLLWEPVDGTTVGLGFRSSVGHELEGKEARQGTPIRIEDFNTPELVTFSVEQRVTDSFRVMGTVEWANWSRVGTYPVINEDTGDQLAVSGITAPLTGPTDVEVALEYTDSWFFSVGGAYDISEALTVRAGIAYEFSPVENDVRSLRLPDDDRLWLSFGASFQPTEHARIDLGYSYIHVGETDIRGSFSGNNGISAEADADVHIISLGARIALPNLFH